MKEVQAGGPPAPGQDKPGQGSKAAAAPAQSVEAAAKFREEELARQKARPFCSLLALVPAICMRSRIAEPVGAETNSAATCLRASLP